jgi:hypothetical protein
MPDPRHIDAGDDPRLAALMAWRQQLIDSGAVSRNAFKEAHLRLVLRSGRTDVAQIRAMLPGSVAEHAEDMARLLAELETQSGGAGESGSAPSRHPAGVRKRESTLMPTRRGCSGRPARPSPRRGTPTKSSTGLAISLRSPSVSSAARCTRLACGDASRAKKGSVPSS